MKCSVDGCNASHRIMVHHPGETEPRPYCAPHALMLARDVMRQQEELAPVIDIKTRKRIGSWSDRYASEKTAGETWDVLKDTFKGIGTDFRDMFSPNRDAFGNLRRDPSQCKNCGKDFFDAKKPKQNLSESEYWTLFQTGQHHLLPQERSKKNDDLCVNCDKKDSWLV